MAPPQHSRQSVYLAEVPCDWKPQRVWSTPPAILSAERSAHNVTVGEAVALARTHNRRQMQRVYRRLPVESWAIVAKYLRPWPCSQAQRSGAGRGAACFTIIEFSDRLSEYWEVVLIRHRPGTVLQRLQKLLATAARPEFQESNVTATTTKDSLLIEFDRGDFDDAEIFATLFGSSLGWKKECGVLVGRAE